jgi:pimeloyl-ACP methyl ester carboxylesterase
MNIGRIKRMCSRDDYAWSPSTRLDTVDQAKSGKSGRSAVWLGNVESVVKALGLKRVILIGHSMGGPVALLAAKRMPGKVIGGIGVDTLQNVEFKCPKK